MTEETAGTPRTKARVKEIMQEYNGLGTESFYALGNWAGSLEREVAALTTQRDRIVELIHGIENRCMAADGPVTQTSDEITERELCMIYALAKGENENWRPDNGK